MSNGSIRGLAAMLKRPEPGGRGGRGGSTISGDSRAAWERGHLPTRPTPRIKRRALINLTLRQINIEIRIHR